MARPQRCRRICRQPEFSRFMPSSGENAEKITLTLDEFEVIRLVDYEHLTHGECAALMDISRTTVTEIYESARYKIADCLVNGHAIDISGGNYRLCDGTSEHCRSGFCHKNNTNRKEINKMRIAVTYENGNIFQHFGHTSQFKFYDVEDGKVVASRVVDTLGSGHGALAGFLEAAEADTLICGGIGGGAQNALAQAGIKLYGGCTGSADAAVDALLDGTIEFNPNVQCSHHDHEHGENHTCSSHGCGSHDCGSHSCH